MSGDEPPRVKPCSPRADSAKTAFDANQHPPLAGRAAGLGGNHDAPLASAQQQAASSARALGAPSVTGAASSYLRLSAAIGSADRRAPPWAVSSMSVTPARWPVSPLPISGAAPRRTRPRATYRPRVASSDGFDPSSRPCVASSDGFDPTSRPCVASSDGFDPTSRPCVASSKGFDPTSRPCVASSFAAMSAPLNS